MRRYFPPWAEPSDFVPAGEPFFRLSRGLERVTVWQVPRADQLLLLHTGVDRVTMALRDQLLVDTAAVEPFNPPRLCEDDGA